MQRNWIGKSSGTTIDFKVKERLVRNTPRSGYAFFAPQVAIPAGREEVLNVFTTRADTVFGCSFLCVAPRHPALRRWLDEGAIDGAHAPAVRSVVEVRARGFCACMLGELSP
ncbi:MAG: hypothetical protein V9G22_13280 [Ottowia sp.]